MKNQHFKLSSTFTNLFANKQPGNANNKSKSIESGLFRLNPMSAQTLEDVPIDMLRKKSRNKLESLKDEGQKFSIFNQKIEKKEVSKQKVKVAKKYHLEQNAGKKQTEQQNVKVSKQQILPFDVVKPSRLDDQPTLKQTNCSLFQTPILPCFKSEIRERNPENVSEFKCVEEKEGVWKIGKIKLKGSRAELNINGIKFEGVKAQVQGRAGVVKDENFYCLKNWKGLWIVQPVQSQYN